MKLKRLGVLAVSLALAFSLALPAQAVSTFTDVPESYWGYTDIMSMYSRGYAKGYGDGTFKPDGKMTAAETLLFCARATGVNSATQEKISADRKEEMEAIIPTEIQSWANKEMAVAVDTGVLSTAELEALARAGALTKTITRENICMYCLYIITFLHTFISATIPSVCSNAASFRYPIRRGKVHKRSIR